MQARHIYRFCLLALIVLYIAVRIWRLTDSCLWFDEIFSVHAAEHSWTGLWSFVGQDLVHPPLYYLLLKIWISTGGESVLWVRSLSVLFSIAALIPFYFLCRGLQLSRLALLTAMFLLAVNGSVLKYSQEARMYSLLMCLSLFSLWLFSRWMKDAGSIGLVVVVNILLVYTHYFGWLVVLAELLAVAIGQRRKLAPFCLAVGATAALFIPWVVMVVTSFRSASDLDQNIGWMNRPGPLSLLYLFFGIVEPFYYQRVSSDSVSDLRVTIPLIVLFAASLIFSVKAAKSKRSGDSATWILLLAILVPITTVFVLSWMLPYSIWAIRHLLFVIPLAVIVFVIAIDEMSAGSFRTVVITLIILFSSYAFVNTLMRPSATYSWCAWENLLREIPPDDSARQLLTFEDLSAYHIWFYERNRIPALDATRVIGESSLPEDRAYFLPRGFDGVRTMEANDIPEGTFWVAFRADDEWNVTKPPVKALILQGYKAITRLNAHCDDADIYLIRLEK